MLNLINKGGFVSADSSQSKLKVLILLKSYKLKINAIRDYVEAFDLYSRHSITYVNGSNRGSGEIDDISYSEFDVLVIPHHCRVCSGNACFDDKVSQAIKTFSGYKVLIIQDEYDRTEIARRWILEHGINHVFTVVPDKYIKKVYDPARFPDVKFTNFLTGYIPESLCHEESIRPMAERPLQIVYRCREQGSWRGELCHQKLEIAEVVKKVCVERHIPVDIEWAEEKLIYGPEWNSFLQSGRATLGSESGSNVFDLDGSITESVMAAQNENPGLSYEDLLGVYFEDENIGVRMNQISPKFFEFIASKTALILFEGEYSGILKPDIHYMPLRRDYSNLDTVLGSLEDITFLEEMVERAYCDVIESGKYQYRVAIGKMDRIFEEGCLGLRKGAWRKREGNLKGELFLTAPVNACELGKYCIGKGGVRKKIGDELEEKCVKMRNFSGMIERRNKKIKDLIRG